MSPLNIHCLLEYYAMPNGSPDIHYRHPMAVDELLRLELIGGMQDPPGPMHKITAKGLAYVEHLIGVPLPVHRWEIPVESEHK